jgi:cytochrome P450
VTYIAYVTSTQFADGSIDGELAMTEPETVSHDSEPLFNPFAPGFTDNPYPHYARVRAAAPVHADPFGYWLLTAYEDVSWLLRAGGLSVEDRNISSGPMLEMRQSLFGDQDPEPVSGMSMLDRDPPDHTRLRKLVSKAFTPRAIEALRPRITAQVDEMLDDVAAAGQVDLVDAFAFPLPFAVIAEMLGTPPADHQRIRELSGTVVRSLEPVADPELAKAILAADDELSEIAAEMIAWKRANPAGDLLTALINAEDDGDVLDDDELIAQTLLLYLAGHETTVNLIGGGTLALLTHPGQLARLRAQPDMVSGAVEELLRYDSPVQASRRITLQPITLRGIEIPPGSFVMASLAAANRDEEFWGTDAGNLDVTRPNARQHVSFGGGPHHCLGASLARLEASIAFEHLITRFPRLRLDGDVTWNGRFNLRGPAHLPVAVN